MLTKEEFTCLARKYMDTVFRVAMNYLKNKTDADDVTQNVLLKFYKSGVDFESEEHVKHWLIRVTLNECKNFLRFPWQKYASLEDYMETLQMPEPEHREMLNAVMTLPTKYRMILYLYYYEGYATAEIADFLQIPNGTVRTRLARGREQLKKILKETKYRMTDRKPAIGVNTVKIMIAKTDIGIRLGLQRQQWYSVQWQGPCFLQRFQLMPKKLSILLKQN